MRNLKKKVALLLALVMMLSLVPMNVFGSRQVVGPGAPPIGTERIENAQFSVVFPATQLANLSRTGIVLNIELGGPNRVYDTEGGMYNRFVGAEHSISYIDLGNGFIGEMQILPNRRSALLHVFHAPAPALPGGFLPPVPLPSDARVQPGRTVELANTAQVLRGGMIIETATLPTGAVFSGTVAQAVAQLGGVAGDWAVNSPTFPVSPTAPLPVANRTIGAGFTLTLPNNHGANVFMAEGSPLGGLVPEAGTTTPGAVGITLTGGSPGNIDRGGFDWRMNHPARPVQGPTPTGLQGLELQITLPLMNINSSEVTVAVRDQAGRTLVPAQPLFDVAQAVDFGVNFAFGGVHHFGDWGGVSLAHLTLTERGRGSFDTGLGGTFWLTLRAPDHYNWAPIPIGDMAISSPNYSRVDLDIVDQEVVGRDLRIQIDPGEYATGPLGQRIGQLRISGLRLNPTIDALPTGNISLPYVWVGPAGNREVGRWRATGVHVATRGIRDLGLEISGAVPTLYSGQRAGWDTTSSVIQLATAAPGSFITNPTVVVDLNQPGVAITGVQWRWARVGTDQPGWGGYAHGDQAATGNTGRGQWTGGADAWQLVGAGNWHMTPGMARFDVPRIATHNVHHNAVLQFRLQLNVVAGFVFEHDLDVIDATVTVHGTRDRIDETVTIANIKDPITISADEPVAVTPVGDVLGFIPPTRVADVTIEETAFGRLRAGDFIYVYAVPTIGGTAAHFHPSIAFGDLGFVTSMTPTITGGDLRLSRGTPVPVGVQYRPFTENPNLPLYRFRVDRASNTTTGPSTITFTNNVISGSVWNVPGMEFTFVVAGNALDRNTGAGVSLARPTPYHAVIGYVPGDHPGAPGDAEEEPGDVEPDPILTVPTVEVERDAVNTVGGPVFVELNGQTWVNLRGLVENIPGGTVGWTMETGAVFSAPHATNGTITSIWQLEVGFEAEVNNNLGTRGARFENIDYTWYVSKDAFQTLFGRVPVIID